MSDILKLKNHIDEYLKSNMSKYETMYLGHSDLELIASVLEKQIPKKIYYMCPCGCVNLSFEYCPKCGQKLDWS